MTKTTDLPVGIDFLKCLYEENEPVGMLGCGTHYSVYRAVVWHDESGRPLRDSKLHDFAIIWDEDHDERVLEVVERVYFNGMLPRFRFFHRPKTNVCKTNKLN